MAWPSNVRATLAEGRDGRVDDSRVSLTYRFVADAESVDGAWSVPLEHDVRRGGEGEKRFSTRVLFQVEENRALVAVERLEEGSVFAGWVAVRITLDQNHVGAEVGEKERRVRARKLLSHAEYTDAG